MKQTLLLLTLTTSLLLSATSKIDEKSGLIWQDNNEVGTQGLNYDEANAYCRDLKVDGYESWRLPTLKEAYSIVDLNSKRPALKRGFTVRDDGRYWTSTRFAKDPKHTAWYISMRYGEAEPYKMSRLYSVRCVHSAK